MKFLKKNLLIIFAIFVSILMGSNAIVKATEDVNVQENNSIVSEDENIRITQQIVENTGDTIKFKVDVENLNPAEEVNKENPVEVILVIDNSGTMEGNRLNLLKQPAIDFVDKIAKAGDKVKISLVDCSGVKVNLGKDTQSIKNNINNLKINGDYYLDDLLIASKNEFSEDSSVQKYIILFTDGADTISEETKNQLNDIEIQSVIIDNDVNTEFLGEKYYINNDASQTMLDELINDIYSKVAFNSSNEAKNLKIDKVFSEDILKVYDIKSANVSKGEMTNTANEYTWDIASHRAGAVASSEVLLQLKSNANFSNVPNSTKVVKNMDVAYDKNEETIKMARITDSPSVGLGFAVEIKFVNEIDKETPISGITAEVIASDIRDKLLYSKEDAVTNNGIISNININQIGYVYLTIEPYQIPAKCKEISQKDIYLNNNGSTVTVDEENTSDEILVEYDKENNVLNITVFVKTDTINFNIVKKDHINEHMYIGNAEFSVTDKNSLKATGTTDKEGTVTIEAENVGIGTNAYILNEEKAPNGYNQDINETINVTIDNDGHITNAEANASGNLEISFDEKNVNIIAKNTRNADFDPVEVKLVDEDDNTINLKDAEYDIYMESENGSCIKVADVTDFYGIINAEYFYDGETQVRIIEKKAPEGYCLDEEEKVVTIRKDDNGELQFVEEKTTSGAEYSIENNKLYILLTNKQKQVQNSIKINTVSATDEDIAIRGMNIELIDPDGETTSGRTDINGSFSIEDIEKKSQGTYKYIVKVLESVIYATPDKEYDVFIEFDENGNILNVSSDELTTFINEEEDNKTIYKNAQINVAIDSDEIMYFKLKKQDILNGANVEGAKYKITVQATWDGDVGEQTIEKETNSDGEINIAIPLGDPIILKVKEISAAPNYKIDDNEKTIKLYDAGNLYALDEETTDGINVKVDNDNNRVILYEAAQKKINGDEKGNINLNIDKISESNETLIGVKFSYTLVKEIKNASGEKEQKIIKSGESTTNELGKIAITDLPIDSEGKYKIYLKEISTLLPYKLANSIIIDLRYEVIDEKLQVQSFIIKKGNDVIQETSTKEYEDDNLFQYDINLKIVNKYKSTIDETDPDQSYNNNNLFYIELNKYKNGSVPLVRLGNAKYKVVITYEDGKQIVKQVSTMGYGDSNRIYSKYAGRAYIRPIYVEGQVTVEITEIEAPAGYELDDTTYKLVVKGNGNDGITEVSSPNIDEYTRSGDKISIKLYDNKKPGPVKATKIDASGFYVQVHKADSINKNILLEKATYKVQLTKDETEVKDVSITTNKLGNASTNKIYEKGEITLKIRETSAPFGYALDSTEKTIQLDVSDTEIKIVQDDENTKVIVDDSNRIVHIYETDERSKFVFAINKVDSRYSVCSIYNALFEIQAEDGTVTKSYRTSEGVSAFYPSIEPNSTKIYTIKETKSPTGYEGLENYVKVQVETDENGYIKSATIIEDEMEDIVGIKTDNKYYLRLNIKNKERTYKYYGPGGGTGSGTGNGTGGTGGTGGTLHETSNIEEADKYSIVFDTRDKDTNELIAGHYDVQLSSSDGMIRKYNGINYITVYNGYGQTTVNFEQSAVANNYYIDSEIKQLVFTRNIDNTLKYVQKSGNFDVSINNNTKVITITVRNKKDELKLTIETVDNLDEQVKLRNAKFNVTDIKTGKIVTTNEYGFGETDLDIPYIKAFEYTVTEQLAPADYLKRAPMVVKVSAQYDSSKNIISAEITEGADFASLTYEEKELHLKITYIEDEEDEYRYQLKVIKQDKLTGVKLADAEFEVDVEKESGVTKKALKTTDELGSFKVNYLRTYGRTVYKIQETKAPIGYKLNDAIKQITISSNGPENVSATCNDPSVSLQVDNINHLIIANITNSVDPNYISLGIENTDSIDERIKIPGSVFEIIDNQTNTVYELTTKEEGIGLVKIPAKIIDGEYTYKIVQKSVPSGYIQLVGFDIELQIKFTSGDIEEAKIIQGNTTFAVARVKKFDERNALVEIMNEKEVADNEHIPDNLKPYSVYVNKVDENNFEIPIPNALLDISITNEIGVENIFVEDRTNEAGIISIKDIDGFGEININVTEKEAPEGRQLDTRIRHITLSRNVMTGKITHTNSENIYYDIDNSTREINLYIVNKEANDKFTIGINQFDTDNNCVGGFKYKIIVEDLDKNIVINDNGYGALSSIPKPESAGIYTYTIKQIEAPEGYKLLQNDITFDVTFNEELNIIKVENVGTPAKLAKTTYSNNADGKLIRTINEITSGVITTGNYIEFVIKNEKMPEYNLELTVVNKDNVSQKLEGAAFEIEFIDTDTAKPLQTISLTDATNSDGKLLIEKITGVGNITIKITQEETPIGYKANTLMQTIKINRDPYTGEITAVEGITEDEIDSETLTVKKQIENELKDGQFILKIEKVNEDNEKLEDAYFSIENGEEEIDIAETDSEGKTERVIPLGKDATTFDYTIKEKIAPLGYKLSEDKNLEIETGIREDGSYGLISAKLDGEAISLTNDEINLQVVDALMDPYTVEIKTVNKNDTTKVATGAKYILRIKKPGTEEVLRTIENAELKEVAGIITANDIYGVGRILIEIEQTKAPYGYKELENKIRRVIIDRDTITGEITKVEGNATVEENKVIFQVENELKEGQVQLQVVKKNTDGDYLQGAKFKVTKDEETVAEEQTTDANGAISFEIMLEPNVGEYTYKIEETKAPSGYRVEALKELVIKTGISDDRYRAIEATIDGEEVAIIQDAEANDIIRIEIVDKKVEGFKVDLETVNAEDTTQKIDGAEYTLKIKNATGNLIKTIENAELTKVSEILQTPEIKAVGNIKIEIEQTKAPEGYEKSEAITKVISRGENTGEITTSDDTIIVDNENQIIKIIVENTPKAPTVSLELTKVDEKQAVLKGAGFTLTKNDQVVGEEKTTADNGKIKFDITLEKSEGTTEYKLEETTVPVGYKKADAVMLLIKVQKQENGSYVVINVQVGKKVTIVSGQGGIGHTTEEIEERIAVEDLSMEDNTASLQVANELIDPYKVEIRTVNKNNTTKIAAGAEYVVRIKNAETGALIKTISNAELEIVEEIAASPEIYGVGRIRIEIEQTKAPYGYEELEDRVATLVIARDIVTGAITIEEGNATVDENKISVQIENELKSGKVKVHVVKKNVNGDYLQGAGFRITKDDEVIATQKVTDSKGQAEFIIDLEDEAGDYIYKLEETEAPSGYKVASPIDIAIKTGISEDRYRAVEATKGGENIAITQDEAGNDIINIEIVDEKVEPFKVEIETINAEDTTQKLDDVEYTVTIENATTNTVLRTISNADLTKISEVLQTPDIEAVGNIRIKVKQTKAPEGYEKSELVTKEISRDENTGEITTSDDTIIVDNENRVVKITVENELKAPTVSIEITKLNEKGLRFSGVGFSLIKENQVVSGQKLTEYNGKVKFDITLERQAGEYTYRIAETSVPAGYKVADGINVTIKVEKQENGSYAVTKVTSGEEELPISNNTVNLSVTNELIDPYKVEIKTVNKNDTDTLAKGAEYVVRIKNANTGATIQTIPNGRLTKLTGISITPDIYGVGRIRIEIEQTKAPEGYEALENNITTLVIARDAITGEITVEEGNATIDENKISVQIENELQEGKVQIQVVKKNADGNYLQGAKFKVTKDNEVVAEEQTTNANGIARFEFDLENEAGDYVYKLEETEAPSGYKIENPKTIIIRTGIENNKYRATRVTIDGENVEVTQDSEGNDVINAEVVDEKVGAFKVEIETVNEEDKTQKLDDVEYTVIIENATTNTVLRTISNADLTKISELLQTPTIEAVGRVRIKISQTKTPEGYEQLQLVTKEISIGENTGEITTEETGVFIDNENRVVKITVENEPKAPTISIDVTKVDENQAVMKGAGFTLKKNGQTVEEEKTTGDNGKAKFDITLDKKVGEAVYELEETTVPNGYKTPSKNVSIKVIVKKTENGSYYVETVTKDDEIVNVSNGVAEITIENELIPPLAFGIMVWDDENPRNFMVGQEFSVKIVNTTTGEVAYSNDKMIVNDVGSINCPDIYGVGNFEITIEQKTFANSVADDRSIKTIKINRNIKNGDITILDVAGNNIKVDKENYADGERTKALIATITNRTVKPYFTLHLDRYDNINKYYKLVNAVANVEIPEEAVVNTDTIRLVTNELGKAEVQVPLPRNEGEYIYTIKDISVPDIYAIATQPIQIKVKVKKDGTYIIESAEMIKNGNAEITDSSETDIYVNMVSKRASSSNNSTIKFNLADWEKHGDYLKVVIENEERQRINISDLYSVTTNSQGQKSLVKIFSAGNITVRIEEKKNDGTVVSSAVVRYNIQNKNITNVTTEDLNNMQISYMTSSNSIVIKLIKGDNELSKSLPNYGTRDLDSDGDPDVIVVPVGTTDKMLYENSLLTEKPQIIEKNSLLRASMEEQETLLCTGMEVSIDDKIYLVAAVGDVCGDGKITLLDLIRVNLQQAEVINLEGVYLVAADLDYNREVNLTDLVRENLTLIGIDFDNNVEEE